MHLKSLTLKGFKSFASATTLRFEPGITCVVGPNGSGKSNVVDALTWVMGEQGAKALRGGKMEDVIFSGTSGRAPLGRAEVTLTIDNADGALAVDHAEVSITRRMFRDGASEYEINGSGCRLMDVQELLSDSGIGREMHVVVGQGRLATILESRPEDRRAFIEEAAGVLKHRKRKEKALRKLEAMQANLTRLSDLTAELGRQLKPLGRQAEVARRAQTVQADVRDARLRLAADDLVTRRAELAAGHADHEAARLRQEQVRAQLAGAEAALAAEELAVAALVPATRAAADTWFGLSSLAERVSATTRLAAERARHLQVPVTERAGRDPDELEAEARRAATQEAELAAAVQAAEQALTGAQTERADREQVLAAAERAHRDALRAVADRREGLVRLAGQVDTVRSRTESRAAEIDRLSTALTRAQERGTTAAHELASVQAQVTELESGESGLDTTHAQAEEALEHATARVAELEAGERDAERAVASGRVRVEALSLGLSRRDGAAWLLEHAPAGVLGPAAQLLRVRPGWEVAVAAALGPAADAVVVDGRVGALAALEALRAGDGGRAGLLVSGAAEAGAPGGPLPDGARWAGELVDCTDALRPAVARLLHGVVVAELDRLEAVLAAGPGRRVVTPAGDLVGEGWAVGGSDRAPSTLEVQAAVDAATAELRADTRRAEGLAAALVAARAERTERAASAEAALAELHRSDAAMAAVAEQLGRLGESARAAGAEEQRLRTQRTQLEQARSDDDAALDELTGRLARAEAAPGEDEPSTAERDAATTALTGARAVEVEARLEQRSATERAAGQRGRAAGLVRSARAERDARARAEEAQRARAGAAALAAAVTEAGEMTGERVQQVLTRARRERDELTARQEGAQAGVATAREQVRRHTAELAGLTDTVHRDEVARAQAALRVEQLEASVVDSLGVGLDELVAEYGPDVELDPDPAELAEVELARERGEQVTPPAPVRYDRAEQQRRLQRAEKDLALLGRVNPLALEEYAALSERHQFLSTQLADVTDTRRDLLGVVADVDARILEVFTAAFHDVAAEFGAVFETLFPGGEGRLVLTDPENMLTTGIEVEARPPGKKIKRLSLLSGGEKSLTAVAMLVAIFRARPSPFYVMDEVEAALDDTNLQRLITLFAQLRERSQLIVITHQKATMEVADALYGVSMRGDGITTVISQRLRGVQTAQSSER